MNILDLWKKWSKFINKEDHKFLIHSKDYGYFSLDVNVIGNLQLKIIVSYHLPTIHPELNKVSNIDDHYHIQGLPNRFAGQVKI